MGLFKLSVLLCLLSQAYSEESLNEVEAAFISNNIVPTVIDTAPKEKLNVTCGKYVVNLGNVIPLTAVLSQPTIEWDADPNTYYTIIMDGYPVKPEINFDFTKSVKHMVLINILGSDVSSGNYLAAYLLPIPPVLSQRYTFLLYKQAKHLELTESVLGQYSIFDRFNFNVTEFVNTFNMTIKSGNFFVTNPSTLITEPLSLLSNLFG